MNINCIVFFSRTGERNEACCYLPACQKETDFETINLAPVYRLVRFLSVQPFSKFTNCAQKETLDWFDSYMVPQ